MVGIKLKEEREVIYKAFPLLDRGISSIYLHSMEQLNTDVALF